MGGGLRPTAVGTVLWGTLRSLPLRAADLASNAPTAMGRRFAVLFAKLSMRDLMNARPSGSKCTAKGDSHGVTGSSRGFPTTGMFIGLTKPPNAEPAGGVSC